ncbi:PPK2 family polyphosphate kinase [Sorangium sp. So ce269]
MPITRLTKPDSKFRLDDVSTDPPRDASKQEAGVRLHDLGKELLELQELMWGARTHSVLIVLQGRDAAGKDGAIKNVVGALNPRGVSVSSFGVPTKEEREHDFLWRIHRQAPRAGEFAIFNRSHYEDVLVVRVHDLEPKSRWGERYDHINDFEELLAEHGTIVIKFFLHISKKEQEERLVEREKNPSTAWKLNVNDWKERELWDEYTEAYEDVFRRCSSRYAPWCIVPADAKWYRNLVVAETVLEAMREHREEWLETLDRSGREGRDALEEYRKTKGVRHKG